MDEISKYYLSLFTDHRGNFAVFTARNDNLELARDHANTVAKCAQYGDAKREWFHLNTHFLGRTEPTRCGEIIAL